jgi:cyclophilin family peptidyl-prolyl cis-trans isomerase
MKKLAALLFTLALSLPVLAAAPQVEIKTSQGAIVVEVYPDKAPKTVANFLQYVKDGFYDGTIFHRVIDGFMIQGGGFNQGMEEKPTRAPIANEAKQALEAGLRNEPGTIAMARTSDPNSATAQFFINLVNNDKLDYPSFDGAGYCVFGRVVKGFDVVQKIGKLPTRSTGLFQDVPVTPVVIQSARIIETKGTSK